MRGGSQVIDAAPPAADTGGGGGWALLLTARGIIEAELIRGVLESQGIVPVALDATDPSPGAWLFLSGNVNALVRVFVPTSLLDAARLTLMEAGVASHDVAEPPPADRAHGDRGRIWMAWVALTIVVVAIFLLATMRASVIYAWWVHVIRYNQAYPTWAEGTALGPPNLSVMRKIALTLCALAFLATLAPARADTSVEGSVLVPTPQGPSAARHAFLFSDKLDGVVGDVIQITPPTQRRYFELLGLTGATGAENLDVYFYKSLEGTGDPCPIEITGSLPKGGESGYICAGARYAVVTLFQGAHSTFKLTY